MINRFKSFLKASNKGVLLRYYYHEKKTALLRLLGGIQKKMVPPGTRGYGRIDLSGQTSRMYGLHRTGWSYAVRQLRDLHYPGGVILDAFLDRTFAVDNRDFTGYSKPWTGFLHVPPGVPGWMESPQSNKAVFASERWQQSLPFCRGLFTLSQYHRDALTGHFSFPVECLLHPTDFSVRTWQADKFHSNQEKKIVLSGWWLRRVYSMYLLDVRGYAKIILRKQDAAMEHHLKLELEHMEEREQITPSVLRTVRYVNFLSARSYDTLLSENIVFLDLIDASANNAILECIARNTPVLVNPLPAVKEYLGADYPLYFHSLEEAALKAEDHDLVIDAHRYLVGHPLKERLTGDYFRRSFITSSIYRSL